MLTANGIAYSFSKFSKCKNARGPSEKAAVCFARTSVQLPNHTWCTSLLLQWVSSKSGGSVFAQPFAPFLMLSRPQRGAKKDIQEAIKNPPTLSHPHTPSPPSPQTFVPSSPRCSSHTFSLLRLTHTPLLACCRRTV